MLLWWAWHYTKQWNMAEPSTQGTQASKEFYAGFLKRMGESYRPDRIKDGEFGAM